MYHAVESHGTLDAHFGLHIKCHLVQRNLIKDENSQFLRWEKQILGEAGRKF